jgi:PIN domain nuclease of toxin-antitoxin system
VGCLEVILLDTHIWLWWVHEDMSRWDLIGALEDLYDGEELAVSAISCWEIAKLVEYGRVDLERDLGEWLRDALDPSAIRLLPLTPRIAIEACRLPGKFHRDPADQIIVATARVHNISLMTADDKIRGYPYVKIFDSSTIHDG